MTNNIQLMHLWLHEITVPDPTDAPQFVLDVVSQALSVSGGKNWIPVIVKEVSKGEYVVVANSFIYAAAENAGLEKAWCVIVDDDESAEYLTKVLAREIVPKLDLATASYEQIQGALEYVSEKPNSALKGFKLLVAVNRIAEAPRHNWKSLDELTKLKCGITKGKKLDALKEVFTLNVKSVKATVDVNEPKPTKSLDSLSLTELKAMAKEKKLKGYSKKTKAELVDLLS
jgi:ParB-like chromosome segregation protein Spo0J